MSLKTEDRAWPVGLTETGGRPGVELARPLGLHEVRAVLALRLPSGQRAASQVLSGPPGLRLLSVCDRHERTCSRRGTGRDRAALSSRTPRKCPHVGADTQRARWSLSGSQGRAERGGGRLAGLPQRGPPGVVLRWRGLAETLCPPVIWTGALTSYILSRYTFPLTFRPLRQAAGFSVSSAGCGRSSVRVC